MNLHQLLCRISHGRRGFERTALLGMLVYSLLLSSSFLVIGDWGDFLPKLFMVVGVWAAFALCHALFVLIDLRGDQFLLPLASAAVFTGLVTIMRLAPDRILRHAVAVWIGIMGLAFLVLILNKLDFSKLVKPMVAVIFALLIGTLLFGTKRGGATSWIVINGFGFQPSEVTKVLSVLVSAYFISRLNGLKNDMGVVQVRNVLRSKDAWAIAIIWASVIALMASQRDFGTALVFFLTCLVLGFAGTGNKKVLTVAVVVGLLASVFAVSHFEHIQARFFAWLNPWAEPNGRGYQIIQGFYALASGGLFGKGYGMGRPDLIPASFTDMNFAAIGEELGLFGAVGILLIMFLMVCRGLLIAYRAKDDFCAFVSLGASSFLAVQTCVIVGGTLGLIPLTGVTLPFVSYGGTSMVASLAMIGIIMAVSSDEDRLLCENSEQTYEEVKIRTLDDRKDFFRKKTTCTLLVLWTVACCVLVMGTIYYQMIASDRLTKDVLNPRVMRTEQEESL